LQQKIQRLSPNKDCCHKLSCECDAEGEEEAAAAVQEDRHDNDSPGGWLAGWRAGWLVPEPSKEPRRRR